jgi:hypothetical protein
VDVRFFKFSAAYLMAAMMIGLAMGITRQFQYAPVHAHVALLGWASQALFALFYRSFTNAAKTVLARCHLVLHNVGLPIFMVFLFLLLAGHTWAQPGVAVGAVITLVAAAMFVINLFRTIGAANLAPLARRTAPRD